MTSISAGLLIYDVLANDAGVTSITSRIFPVVSEKDSPLPYICYRRASNETTAAKNIPGANACIVELACYAATYAGSIKLAEAVRNALDGIQAEFTDGTDRLVARSIQLMDSEEGWADDAYFQTLTFAIRIN